MALNSTNNTFGSLSKLARAVSVAFAAATLALTSACGTQSGASTEARKPAAAVKPQTPKPLPAVLKPLPAPMVPLAARPEDKYDRMMKILPTIKEWCQALHAEGPFKDITTALVSYDQGQTLLEMEGKMADVGLIEESKTCEGFADYWMAQRSIILAGRDLRDMAPLLGLRNVVGIDIGQNWLTDVSFLNRLPKLVEINISLNYFEGGAGVNELPCPVGVKICIGGK
jgi:hypothetical protein